MTPARRRARAAHRVLAAASLAAAPFTAAALGAQAAPGGAVVRAAPDSARARRTTLPAVIVVGTAERAITGIPGAVSVIESATLARLAPVSVKEALRKAPGVHVADEDAFGLNLNVGFRGLTARRAQRVLLLEDGMPIHLGPYSDPSAHYHPPVDALARVEIVKGSAQVLFGPQTVGGVINFVRAAPPATPGGSLRLTGGSRDYATGRLRVGGTWNGRGVVLDAGRRQGDGTRRGHHHRVEDLTLRGVFPVGSTQRLAVTAGRYREASRYGEAGLSQREFGRDPYQNPLPNDVFDLTRHALQAVHELAPRPGLVLRTRTYAQHVDRTAWRQASTSADRLGSAAYERAFRCAAGAATVDACGNTGRPRRYAFAGVEPRLVVAHALGRAAGELEAGARIHEERMRRQERAGATARARAGPLTRDNQIDTRAAALFVQERLRAGSWTVAPGVRVEHVRSANTNRLQGSEQRDRYTEVLPGLGVTWAPRGPPRGAVTLFAGVHRGFAPPRPADVLNPVPGEGVVRVDAEVSWTSEAGVRARVRDWARFDVTAFRVDFDNQVVRGNLAGAGQRYVNAGRTLHQGMEIGSTLDVSRLLSDARAEGAGSLSVEAAYVFLPTARFADGRASTVDARQSVFGRRVPFAPRHVLNLGLDWTHPAGVSVRLDGDVVSSQFADDLNTVTPTPDGQRGLVPRYAVLNLSARAPLWGAAAAPVLVGAVKNVADRVYITDRQEGIMTGAPRLVTVGVEWAF